MWQRMGLVMTVVLSLAFMGRVDAQDQAGADKELSGNIEALIKQLGDDNYERREAAQKELIGIGAPAIPAVKKALLGQDAEVTRRCKAIIDDFNVGHWDRLLLNTLKARQAFYDGLKASGNDPDTYLPEKNDPKFPDILEWVGGEWSYIFRPSFEVSVNEKAFWDQVASMKPKLGPDEFEKIFTEPARVYVVPGTVLGIDTMPSFEFGICVTEKSAFVITKFTRPSLGELLRPVKTKEDALRTAICVAFATFGIWGGEFPMPKFNPETCKVDLSDGGEMTVTIPKNDPLSGAKNLVIEFDDKGSLKKN
jgi:hypothetical protein